ncbi:MAG: thioredoxin [Cyanobacteria bacterium PR.023]|jgi:thioredoxin 1|nr:thioredoxin [Cyanobacteria bacterium PR.023]MDQ5937568.1 thioredoxin 1 [Cyanobacteriota bacterium erpe_2018_sw_21hr_WHONDRS-SW48-000092_B_bin.40]
MKSALLSTLVVIALASSFALTCCAAPSETSKTSGPELVKVSGDASFQKDVLESKLPVVVDFYADWCGPCKMLAPIVEDLAKEYDGKVVFYRINIDKNEALANKFEITSIPALKVFKNGKIVADALGFKTAEQLRPEIQKAL